MADKDNVVVLGWHADRASMMTPVQLLEEVVKELKDETSDVYNTKKVIVLLLNDNENRFQVLFRQCGLKCSEMLSTVEVFKRTVFKLMGY